MIRVDNGPELVYARLDDWCREHKITLIFIQPGKPTQNGYFERCNGTIRQKAEEWKREYNEQKPHKSPGHVPPAGYKAIS